MGLHVSEKTVLDINLSPECSLPEDHERACLVGRVWRPAVC